MPVAQTPLSLTFEALAKSEDALLAWAGHTGVSDDLEKRFERYQKLKALALRAGTDAEQLVALERAWELVHDLIRVAMRGGQ